MSLFTVPRSAAMETVIPDCCNIGVVLRSILAVNLAVLIAVMLRSDGWQAGLIDFVESALVVELACLWSLLALCGVRRLALVRHTRLWAQRILCTLVPALVTAAVIRFLSSFDWFAGSFAHLSVLNGLLAAALFGIALQHYFELRTRAFSPALVEARLQALQARIRPHFLFNSLNAVLSLIRTAPRQAEAALEDLADLFRVLMRDARNMTSLEEELRLCRQYLSIEKIRLGERLQVRWERGNVSDATLRRAQVPALLLQPLLENAVHYGVEPVPAPSLISVRLNRSIDRIDIVIANPYHGQDQGASGNNLALQNIRERLALLFDVEAQLSTSVVDGKFNVHLRFPYLKSPT
ncbi:sensor histidine kinase [Herminiimonas sp. CN]|uniref:sensor histidine kinase n=1 Tax=Herminiimonas sp. CN TaxID=1349818 RepID=UPI001EE67DCD|nr:histidine kinase [Herminiimonas sp. CN]